MTLGYATPVPLCLVLISFGFAALVGIFFGIDPARKASRLDPIEALRYQERRALTRPTRPAATLRSRPATSPETPTA